MRELTIRIKAPPSKSYELPDGSFGLGGSISEFDEVTRKFQAAIAVTIGSPEINEVGIPMYLKVELVGGFIVKDSSLKRDQVMAWAQRAAQFTLIPYVREQVAALTGRAGFTPILIPLIQIPTEKVVVTSPSKEEIAFAKARHSLQELIAKTMREAVEASGFELRGSGGRLEGPDGYINPQTLRNQKLRLYVSFRDAKDTEWRIEAIIGHTDEWLPTVDLLSDSGPHLFLKATAQNDHLEQLGREIKIFVESVINKLL